MACLHQSVTDPLFAFSERLREFPWLDQIYMWEWDALGRYQLPGMRLNIWHDPDESLAQDGAAYCADAHRQHIDCWRWLEERFDMLDVPELRTSGQPSFIMGEGQVSWRMLQNIGTYRIGRARSLISSSSTSTPKPPGSAPEA